MRILIVSQYFWPENFRVNDLTQELVQRGHAVTILTGIPNYPAGKVFDAFQKDRQAYSHFVGANVLRVPMLARGSGSLRLALNYLSFVLGACLLGPWRLRGQRFDVIFVYEPSPATVGLPAILLGRLKRAPVVFWALDLWPETLAAVGVVRSPLILSAVGRMVSFIYNRCALVLGQSRGFLGSIEKYCVDANKIRYFPSWAEDAYSHNSGRLAPEVPVQEGSFNVLFAGNVGEAQDFPAVLDAAEHLKDNSTIRWLIVGDGRMSDWLTREVMRRGLEKCVLLLGRFPYERMPSFFAHANVLLVSLKADPVFSLTIPGKIQSYLMAGMPLVGMLDGEGAKVICEAQAGLACAAGDSVGLAQAVRKLSTMSSDERLALGRNGRAYAKQEFERIALIDRLEKWLDEVSSKRRVNQPGK